MIQIKEPPFFKKMLGRFKGFFLSNFIDEGFLMGPLSLNHKMMVICTMVFFKKTLPCHVSMMVNNLFFDVVSNLQNANTSSDVSLKLEVLNVLALRCMSCT